MANDATEFGNTVHTVPAPHIITGDAARAFLDQMIAILQTCYPFRNAGSSAMPHAPGSILQKKYTNLLASLDNNNTVHISREEVANDLKGFRFSLGNAPKVSDERMREAIMRNFDLCADNDTVQMLRGEDQVRTFVTGAINKLKTHGDPYAQSAIHYLNSFQGLTWEAEERFRPVGHRVNNGVMQKNRGSQLLTRPTLEALLSHWGYDSRDSLVLGSEDILSLFDRRVAAQNDGPWTLEPPHDKPHWYADQTKLQAEADWRRQLLHRYYMEKTYGMDTSRLHNKTDWVARQAAHITDTVENRDLQTISKIRDVLRNSTHRDTGVPIDSIALVKSIEETLAGDEPIGIRTQKILAMLEEKGVWEFQVRNVREALRTNAHRDHYYMPMIDRGIAQHKAFFADLPETQQASIQATADRLSERGWELWTKGKTPEQVREQASRYASPVHLHSWSGEEKGRIIAVLESDEEIRLLNEMEESHGHRGRHKLTPHAAKQKEELLNRLTPEEKATLFPEGRAIAPENSLAIFAGISTDKGPPQQPARRGWSR